MHTFNFVGLFTLGVLAVVHYLWSTSYIVKVAEEKFGKDNVALENLIGSVTWVLWSFFLMGLIFSLLIDFKVITETPEGYLRTANGTMLILYIEGFFAIVSALQWIIFKPWWKRLSKRYETHEVVYARR